MKASNLLKTYLFDKFAKNNQQTNKLTTLQENKISYYSHILGRHIEIVITGHWGYPIVMFPTSMGNVYQNKDFGLLDAISNEIQAGKVKVYNVESIDFQSFYNKDLPPNIKIYNYNLYTEFLHKELYPWIQRECSVHRVAVAGCSFGAYHAANFAFKYPDAVSHLFSMSGVYSIKSFMNGYYDDLVYYNSPTDFMPNQEEWKYNHQQLVLGTSDWDICKTDTLNMSQLLSFKGINHWYDEKKWASHDWPLWKMMLAEYIHLI